MSSLSTLNSSSPPQKQTTKKLLCGPFPRGRVQWERLDRLKGYNCFQLTNDTQGNKPRTDNGEIRAGPQKDRSLWARNLSQEHNPRLNSLFYLRGRETPYDLRVGLRTPWVTPGLGRIFPFPPTGTIKPEFKGKVFTCRRRVGSGCRRELCHPSVLIQD